MNSNKKSGFTVIEVLIAITLGIILLGIIISIFSNNKRAYQQNNQMIELQNYVNFSMTMLAEELTNVGFYGSILYRDTVNIAGITMSTTDCTGTPVGTAGIDLINNPAGAMQLAMPLWGRQASAAAEAGCISNALPGSDYIVLKSVVGQTTDDADLGDEIYLRTGQDIGQLFIGPSNSTVAIANSTNMNWQFQNHIFYISTAFQLVRKTLTRTGNTTLGWEDQVLVGTGIDGDAGIEDMQILYGIDSDVGPADGVANYFVDASAISVSPVNLWHKVVAVKIFFLGRSAREGSYTDNKTYQLGDKTVTPASLEDNYHRKVFSTTILLRNNWYLVRGDI
jgi:type IV pilus assembly protein PilW